MHFTINARADDGEPDIRTSLFDTPRKLLAPIKRPDHASDLRPGRRAFISRDACGYCDPGQIRSTVGMIHDVASGRSAHPAADLATMTLDDSEIAAWTSGNLCHCAARPGIVDAIREIAAGGAARGTAIWPQVNSPERSDDDRAKTDA